MIQTKMHIIRNILQLQYLVEKLYFFQKLKVLLNS